MEEVKGGGTHGHSAHPHRVPAYPAVRSGGAAIRRRILLVVLSRSAEVSYPGTRVRVRESVQWRDEARRTGSKSVQAGTVPARRIPQLLRDWEVAMPVLTAAQLEQLREELVKNFDAYRTQVTDGLDQVST